MTEEYNSARYNADAAREFNRAQRAAAQQRRQSANVSASGAQYSRPVSGQIAGAGSARTAQGAQYTRSAAGKRRVAQAPDVISVDQSSYRGYSDGTRQAVRYKQPRRFTSSAGFGIIVLLLVAALAAVAWWLWPKNFDVTLNGESISVSPGTTASQLLEQQQITLTPGNLLAVDGALLEAGAGNPGTVLAGDTVLDMDAALEAGMELTTADGTDKTEDATEVEEVIPAPMVSDSRSFDNYWGGSIHLLANGQDGLQVTRTGAISGKTVTSVVTPAIPGGYQVYTAQPAEKVIALTFDDGPWPDSTSQILDILQQYGAKATFFTIGNQVAEYADDIQRAQAMGCEICTHTWDHASGSGGGTNLTYMSDAEQIEEVTRGFDAIREVTGEEPPHIMRAPGGNFYDEIIDTLWSYLDAEIGWDVDTEDWSKPGVDYIAQMIESVQPGQVVLMHDGGGDRSQTVEALRQALPVLVNEGYSFVTVSELMAYGNPEHPVVTTEQAQVAPEAAAQ